LAAAENPGNIFFPKGKKRKREKKNLPIAGKERKKGRARPWELEKKRKKGSLRGKKKRKAVHGTQDNCCAKQGKRRQVENVPQREGKERYRPPTKNKNAEFIYWRGEKGKEPGPKKKGGGVVGKEGGGGGDVFLGGRTIDGRPAKKGEGQLIDNEKKEETGFVEEKEGPGLRRKFRKEKKISIKTKRAGPVPEKKKMNTEMAGKPSTVAGKKGGEGGRTRLKKKRSPLRGKKEKLLFRISKKGRHSRGKNFPAAQGFVILLWKGESFN